MKLHNFTICRYIVYKSTTLYLNCFTTLGLGKYHLLWVPIIAASGFAQSSCLTLPTVIMVCPSL